MTKISTANIKPAKTEHWLAKRNHPQRDLLEKELQQRFFPRLASTMRQLPLYADT